MKDANTGNKQQAPQQKPDNSPVPSDIKVPQPSEQNNQPGVIKEEQSKEEGFKEYTIE